jgi:hypothetical protein
VSKAPRDVPFFAASPRFTETKNRGGQPAISFSDAQGLSIDGDIAIDVGGLSDAMTDNIIWPVLTRARNNIFIVVAPSLPNARLLQAPIWGSSIILSAIMEVASQETTACIVPAADPNQLIARAVRTHLAHSLTMQAAAFIGAAPAVRYVSDNSLTRVSPQSLQPRNADFFAVNTWSRLSMEDVRPSRAPGPSSVLGFDAGALAPEYSAPRHAKIAALTQLYFPITVDTELTARPAVDRIPPPIAADFAPDPAFEHGDHEPATTRERGHPSYNELTAQFPDHGASGAPQHRRADRVTNRISEEKRLRVGRQDPTLTSMDRGRVRKLKDGFKVFFDLSKWEGGRFSPAVFDLALRNALQSWAGGKDLKAIARSLADSPVDWDPKFTRLFLKSQTVKKLGAQYRPAKAGQIVATFPKDQVFADAVWAKYVEYVLERMRRPTTYLHNQPLTGMMCWYDQFWSPGAMTASDYTAWDSGCDLAFAHFDAYILAFAGVPQDYIDAYLDRKVDTRCYRGPLLTMQFSGDRWTWLFNTTRNAALTGATFKLPVGTPAAFSGDDMVLLGSHEYRATFRARDWLMVPKLELGTHLDFCGFTFGGPRPVVSGAALVTRARIARDNAQSKPEFWDSFDAAARHGDSADPLLSNALAIAADVRLQFRLPPSKFPNLPPRSLF